MKITIKGSSVEVEGHAETQVACTTISALLGFLECAAERDGYEKYVLGDRITLKWYGDLRAFVDVFENFVRNLNVEVWKV